MHPSMVDATVVPANLSLNFWCGSPAVAIPTTVSMSQNNLLILLTFRITVLSNVGSLPSVVVTFRYMICLPIVDPHLDSRKAEYKKNRSPSRRSSDEKENGHPCNRTGNTMKRAIIRAIMRVMMLSIAPAISLLNQ